MINFYIVFYFDLVKIWLARGKEEGGEGSSNKKDNSYLYSPFYKHTSKVEHWRICSKILPLSKLCSAGIHHVEEQVAPTSEISISIFWLPIFSFFTLPYLINSYSYVFSDLQQLFIPHEIFFEGKDLVPITSIRSSNIWKQMDFKNKIIAFHRNIRLSKNRSISFPLQTVFYLKIVSHKTRGSFLGYKGLFPYTWGEFKLRIFRQSGCYYLHNIPGRKSETHENKAKMFCNIVLWKLCNFSCESR